jgi:hypothetical protein
VAGSTKDASVRLNLAASGFLSALQQIDRETKTFTKTVEEIGNASDKSSRKTSGFFSTMKAGAKGAGSELSQLGAHLKSVLTTAATLGGALSIGGGIREAQSLQSSYKDLAFAIRRGTGEAQSWQQVQGDVETISGRWKRSNREIQASYADIFQETGNLEFAKRATDSVGQAANATGKSTELWARIAGTLGEKFNIGAGGIHEAMATVVDLTNKGGITADELSEKLGLAGASAQFLGLTGQQGLQKILGMLNLADNSLGTVKQKFGAVTDVLQKMGDPETLKNIEKALGVKLTDPKGNARADSLDRILAKTRGKDAELAKAFQGNDRLLIGSLAKPFTDAFEKTKGDVKTKTAAGLDAFHKAIEEAGKSSFKAADLQNEANERNKDAQRNLQSAMNDFTKAFERPEVVHAVDQLAAQAPRMAGVLGRLVEFAAAHPQAAAAMAVGGVAAKGALTAVITKVSEGAMDSAGKLLGKSLESSWTAGGKLAGASFVLAAGAAGYEIGKQLADYFLNKDQARSDATNDAASTAEAMAKHGTGTTAERKQAADALRSKIADMEKNGPSEFTTTVGAWGAKFAGDPELDPRVRHQRDIANAKAQLAALEASKPAPTLPQVAAQQAAGAPTPPSAEATKVASEVARGDGKVTITNEQAMAAAFARAQSAMTLNVRIVDGGGSGSNGLPPAPSNASGSAPR